MIFFDFFSKIFPKITLVPICLFAPIGAKIFFEKYFFKLKIFLKITIWGCGLNGFFAARAAGETTLPAARKLLAKWFRPQKFAGDPATEIRGKGICHIWSPPLMFIRADRRENFFLKNTFLS
jgi:hypothetical protein